MAVELTTIEAVRAYVQPQDASADDLLNRMIDWASEAVRSYISRPITIPPVTETRELRLNGERNVWLGDKLVDVTSVSRTVPIFVEGEPYASADVFTGYSLQQTQHFTVLRSDIPYVGKIAVTGTWGWMEVPSDIEYAVVLAVDAWYRANQTSMFEGGGEGNTRPPERVMDIPDHAQNILEPWKLEARVY